MPTESDFAPRTVASSATKVVAVELQGGLGNQMFQYAAGFALARKHDAQLKLDLGSFQGEAKRRYMLDCFGVGAVSNAAEALIESKESSRVAILVKRTLSLRGRPGRSSPQGVPVYVEPSFHYDVNFAELRPPVHLRGYFQSALYFAHVEDEIRRLFSRVVLAPQSFHERLGQIRKASFPVSVHVRRGDYITEPSTNSYHGICTTDYYARALKVIEGLAPEAPTYFVFGDDNDAMRTAIQGERKVTIIEGDVDRPWEDLMLMRACRGHVLANSSLSWWGAWLDDTPDKLVVAPRDWFSRDVLRQTSTADLFCAEWITL